MRTLNTVRKEIWSNAFYGLGLGSLSGFLIHSLAAQASHRKWLKNLQTNRNTAFMSVMLGGAIGSFVLATTTGKNEVHQLHSIFESGSRESRRERSDPALQRVVERENELNALIRHRRSNESDRAEALSEKLQQEKDRLIRRASLEQGPKP